MLAWMVWRRRSDSTLTPELGRGLLVVGCILIFFFPVISITDDLAQTPILAEGNKLQDVLKAPELRHFAQLPVVATLTQVILLTAKVTLWRDMEARAISPQTWSWDPNIEKRPPPETL